MSELKILTIDGLTMRPIQISDLDSLAVIWSDPKVTSFLPSRAGQAQENLGIR